MNHWYCSLAGGEGEGARPKRPTFGQFFFHFHAVYEKIGQKMGWRPTHLDPPQRLSVHYCLLISTKKYVNVLYSSTFFSSRDLFIWLFVHGELFIVASCAIYNYWTEGGSKIPHRLALTLEAKGTSTPHFAKISRNPWNGKNWSLGVPGSNSVNLFNNIWRYCETNR